MLLTGTQEHDEKMLPNKLLHLCGRLDCFGNFPGMANALYVRNVQGRRKVVNNVEALALA